MKWYVVEEASEAFADDSLPIPVPPASQPTDIMSTSQDYLMCRDKTPTVDTLSTGKYPKIKAAGTF